MTAPVLTHSLREFFKADAHGAAAVYLFGSRVRGTAGPNSDIDLGVLLVTPPPSTLEGQPFDVADMLTRELGQPVDIVVLNTAPVDLRIRVLRDGVLVFEGDPVARVRFEVATRNEAFDLEPILREYRRPRRTA